MGKWHVRSYSIQSRTQKLYEDIQSAQTRLTKTAIRKPQQQRGLYQDVHSARARIGKIAQDRPLQQQEQHRRPAAPMVLPCKPEGLHQSANIARTGVKKMAENQQRRQQEQQSQHRLVEPLVLPYKRIWKPEAQDRIWWPILWEQTAQDYEMGSSFWDPSPPPKPAYKLIPIDIPKLEQPSRRRLQLEELRRSYRDLSLETGLRQ